MRVLLVSTYDLGRQPTGLAAAAGALRRDGHQPFCVDTSREPLTDAQIAEADRVSFYLPMHTATRLAAPIIDRVRRVNPAAPITAFGLYAQLNVPWLAELGVQVDDMHGAAGPPDRTGLPALARYATLQMPDGTRRVVGNTEGTHGCKHLCRHCPIVPVYKGRFRAVPVDMVLDDVRAQVAAGAEHITFGDPDFFNGPTHARRIVERLARECPGVTYDVTIKVQHLLQHAALLPVLRDTGCLFVTSAVESVDDRVLDRLAKGHTRADFERAVDVCRDVGLLIAPTFVPFTPWTTIDGYVDLLDTIERLDLVEHVPAVQLAIRLLVTANSPLLELDDVRSLVQPFDPASLTWPWLHPDPRVDALQQDVMRLAGTTAGRSRTATFAAIANAAYRAAGRRWSERPVRSRATIPYLNEPWYC